MRDDVNNFIINVLINNYYVNEEAINVNTVYEDLALDSLVLLEIIAMVEKQFSIKVPMGLISPEMTIAESTVNLMKAAA